MYPTVSAQVPKARKDKGVETFRVIVGDVLYSGAKSETETYHSSSTWQSTYLYIHATCK